MERSGEDGIKKWARFIQESGEKILLKVENEYISCLRITGHPICEVMAKCKRAEFINSQIRGTDDEKVCTLIHYMSEYFPDVFQEVVQEALMFDDYNYERTLTNLK